MKSLNKWQKAALREALFTTPVPIVGSVKNPHEHFIAEVVSRTLVALRYRDTKAHDLAREFTGSPEKRLVKIFNRPDR